MYFPHSVQSDSGAHSADIQWGVKRPVFEADHSPLSSTEVKNGGTIPPLYDTSLWCDA
jgi:hypothetical protein